jgi:hypothetical protein
MACRTAFGNVICPLLEILLLNILLSLPSYLTYRQDCVACYQPEPHPCVYAMAQNNVRLRVRIKSVVLTIPLPLPRFWLVALAGLGEAVDFDGEVPDSWAGTTV